MKENQSNKKYTIEFIEKPNRFGDKELTELYGGQSCFINMQCGCKSDQTHSNSRKNSDNPSENSTNGQTKFFRKYKSKNGYCFIVCIE